MKFILNSFYLLLILLVTSSFKADAQAPVITDSSLQETLTRAVYLWKEGKAKDTFISLDSINEQVITVDNSVTKIKAAVWTANYLMAQRKLKPASSFLDSATIWAENFSLGNELIKVYETYSDWHLASGNPKTAMFAKEAAWKIKDSLSKKEMLMQMDSLQSILNSFEKDKLKTKESNEQNDSVLALENARLQNWIYILSGVCFVLLILLFMMNGNLQRLRRTPPSPLPDATLSRPRVVTKPVIVPSPFVAEIPAPEIKKETIPPPIISEEKPDATTAKAEKKELQISNNIHSTTAKLAEVELILIKADVLAKYKNGESKPIRNLLNEYMAQLPFIMKTLDDAIALNEKDTILNSLEHLKTYLVLFGMQSTLTLISEIEEESKTEKVSKLLSRVFQVRNHCRRAADEGKSLLEKIG